MRTNNPVTYINQMPKWPTGCESVSTVMLLNYLNCDISVDEFITYLPMKPLIQKGELVYGESPREYFIGSPYTDDSFGCYGEVIIKTVNQYAAASRINLRAKDISHLSTDEMIRNYIQKGIPVIYWATIDLKPSYTGPSWYLNQDGQLFTWISNEHCMLLTGEEDDHYIFADPWNNHGIIAYPKPLAEQRHQEMLSMAVSIT